MSFATTTSTDSRTMTLLSRSNLHHASGRYRPVSVAGCVEQGEFVLVIADREGGGTARVAVEEAHSVPVVIFVLQCPDE